MSKKSQEKETLIFEFIKSYLTKNSYPPSIREICSALNINSTATIQYHINSLVKSGKIKKGSNKNRAIEIVKKEQSIKSELNFEIPNTILVPVVGKVAAGVPILAVENIEEHIALPQNMFNYDDELFVLKVSGDSMINCGILSGDKIVVKKQISAENGDIVVALVDDSATVKRFYKENGHYRLQPENDFMQPIIVDDVDILGKVVGLVRKF